MTKQYLRILDLVVAEVGCLVKVGTIQILDVHVLAQTSASVKSDEAGIVFQVAL